MKISVRGWGRDMGPTELIEHSLSDLDVSEDGTTSRNGPPTIYKVWLSAVAVGWHQQLRQTGSYRMDLELSRADIIKLFKATYGDELTPAIVADCRFKMSPEFEKAALGKVKLGELTLAELATLMRPKEGSNTDPA
jgi:hypothetical protein